MDKHDRELAAWLESGKALLAKRPPINDETLDAYERLWAAGADVPEALPILVANLRALRVENARLRADRPAEPDPEFGPYRWEGSDDSGYIRLAEDNDLYQNEGDPDPREGMARRLEATARDLRLAIIEGRQAPKKG